MDSAGQAAFHGVQLVKLLTGLNHSGNIALQGRFADRFGQLMDFSGSIKLSVVHEELDGLSFEPKGCKAETIRDEFLKRREKMLRRLMLSFVPGPGPQRSKLPTAEALHAHYKWTGVFAPPQADDKKFYDSAFEPFREFYAMHQREMAIRIEQLRIDVRKMITGLSLESAKLSKLDEALYEALSSKTRVIFTAIPKILGKHFGLLMDEHRQELSEQPTVEDLSQWMTPCGWINQFSGLMREVLLAEFEVRLQPVLGLVKAQPTIDLVPLYNKEEDQIRD